MHPLLRKYATFIGLSPKEEQALLSVLGSPVQIPCGVDIVSEDDEPSRSAMLLDGLACRYKVLGDGGRQIMAFQVAGDATDLYAFALKRMDHSVGALTPCKVSYASHEALNALREKYPNIALAFWRDTLLDSAYQRQWMVGLGRRSGYDRIAHLLCEIAHRFSAAGLGEDDVYRFPFTQAVLADAMGLSTVHVNRVLQRLRADGLIALSKGALTILDEAALRHVGGFEPPYTPRDPDDPGEGATEHRASP